MREGESPLVKRKPRGTITNFTLIQGDGKKMEPWKDKKAEAMEWIRNSSVLLGDLREEIATFWKIEKGPIYYEDSIQGDKVMELAYFTSEIGGRPYDVAARLLDKNIKIGDRVTLEIMGCCSISNVTKEKRRSEEEERE